MVYSPRMTDQTPTGNTQASSASRWQLIALTAIIAIVLGFGGGLASRALFPAKQGKIGPQGVAGKPGPPGNQGATGPAGSAANLDLSRFGYCVNIQYGTSNTVTYVSSVGISDPIDNDGTLSCPSGTYTNLEPVLPDGNPSHYTP